MPHYKLYYFDGRGAAEQIRQLFVLSGEEFDDIRLSQEEWKEKKDQMPFQQLPVLEVDGQMLPQSFAITRYLARKFGFAGGSVWEEAQVDALAAQWLDFMVEIIPFICVLIGHTEGDLEKLKDEVFMPLLKNNAPFFINALEESGSGILMGKGLTYVDLPVAEFVAALHERMPDVFENYQMLVKHSKKVRAIPKLKEWIEKRPITRF